MHHSYHFCSQLRNSCSDGNYVHEQHVDAGAPEQDGGCGGDRNVRAQRAAAGDADLPGARRQPAAAAARLPGAGRGATSEPGPRPRRFLHPDEAPVARAERAH